MLFIRIMKEVEAFEKNFSQFRTFICGNLLALSVIKKKKKKKKKKNLLKDLKSIKSVSLGFKMKNIHFCILIAKQR